MNERRVLDEVTIQCLLDLLPASGVLEIPEGVTEIPCAAFETRPEIQVALLPETVTVIGSRAFSNCLNLRSVQIPCSVLHLGEHSFSGSSLEKVIIPGSIERVPQYAFSFCMQLSWVVVRRGVAGIDRLAFSDCVKLRSVYLEDPHVNVSSEAFVQVETRMRGKTVPDLFVPIGSCSDCFAEKHNYKFVVTDPELRESL